MISTCRRYSTGYRGDVVTVVIGRFNQAVRKCANFKYNRLEVPSLTALDSQPNNDNNDDDETYIYYINYHDKAGGRGFLLHGTIFVIFSSTSSLSSPQCGLASDVIHSHCDIGAVDLASFVLSSSLHLFSWRLQLCLSAFTSGVICSYCVLNPGENWTGYAGT